MKSSVNHLLWKSRNGEGFKYCFDHNIYWLKFLLSNSANSAKVMILIHAAVISWTFA